MDLSLERDGSVLGSLFNQIITDMKNTSPLWEDFIAKAGKLHACLRAAIQAIAAYLDAFQKIADAATNSRGATKEIGTALTRVCLRHKAVETRLKTFTNAIMDCLVLPLQDKLEDWKRSVVTIDKEHAKEHKRCRAELKKRSSDTLRLQKKARKGQSDTIQSLVDSHMQDVTLRRAELEEVEKKSLRSAMIEERMRYCTFVDMLQPVVKEECEVMSELGHLQEAMQSIALVTKEPAVLPQVSEELILDAKTAMSLYPESPGGGSGSQGGCSNSLGSRKSSVCSISSMNSSGSSGSPGHHHYQRSLSQFVSPAIRLKPGESSDSGFCSSPALTSQASTAANPSHAVSTWPPHSQDIVAPPATDRPHTISTAYEKGHQRPPLTVYTFQNPETILEGGGANAAGVGSAGSASGQTTPSAQKPPGGTLSRPPLPVRCSSLERPLSANNNRGGVHALSQRQCPSPIPAHITKELSAAYAQQHHQQQQSQQQQQQQQHPLQSSPTYVNMSELASMAAIKTSNQPHAHSQQHHQAQHGAALPHSTLQQQQSADLHSSIASLVSNDSTITHTPLNYSASTTIATNTNMPQGHAHGHGNHSHSSASSSATPSLHSHPSIDSTVATPLVGQTPTPSSGCSTPQNHYSPLLTNSPSSTAAGTPSGGSSVGGGGDGGGSVGFVYGIDSSTPTQVVAESCSSPPDVCVSSAGEVAAAEDGFKVTDTNSAVSSAAAATTTTTPNIETSTQYDDSSSAANNTDSSTIVENDERSRASVLQKASMFEKQAAAAAANKSTPQPCSGGGGGARNSNAIDNSGGLRRMDDYRAPTPLSHQQTDHVVPDKEADKSFEDSIQELNNLIGELDSFQREIDESTQHKQRQQQQSQYHQQQQQQQHLVVDGNDNNISGKQSLAEVLPATTTIKAAARVAVNTTTTTLAAAATTLLSYQQAQQQHQQQQQLKPTYCTTVSSNQTNSSGCGTDISDATSEELVVASASGNNNGNDKNSCNYGGCGGGDSEQGSRCCVSETSSLGAFAGVNDCDGFENPTFEHFADSRSVLTVDDGISQTSETFSTSAHPRRPDGHNGAADVTSIGAGVVVIYDHQIPITPDVDYVKKNSEIVVLRTKDPQQVQHYQQQEMRELQQLPTNLSVLDGGSATVAQSSTPCNRPPPHTATVQPANQRLSSFRASSEQQLQVLSGCTGNISLKQQQQPLKGGATRIARRSSVNAAKPPPPVRRSSSVTPSQNISTVVGQQQQQQHQQQISASSTANTFDLIHQEEPRSMSNSIESLPPPPAYLLLDQRPSHYSPTTTPTTPLPPSPSPPQNVVPVSVERQQPASPSGTGRIDISRNCLQQQHLPHYHRLQSHQQQQQQQQQLTALQNLAHKNTRPGVPVLPAPNCPVPASSKSSLLNSGAILNDACHSLCVDVHPAAVLNPASTPCTPPLPLVPSALNEETPPPSTNFETEPIYHIQQNQQEQQQHKPYHILYAPIVSSPPSPLPQTAAGLKQRHSADPALPPPLPPPNPKRHQQRQSHVQHQQQQQQSYKRDCESHKIYGNQSSLRTSSPGIYAQPKISNNMSSFRTPSPSSNNVHQLHQPQAQQLPPAQPKTNPNLIAQLSARLNKQQHQQQGSSGGSDGAEATVYSSSAIPPSHQQEPNEAIYMRNNGLHRHHHHHHQQQQLQQQQQQQHNHDVAAPSNRTQSTVAPTCATSTQHHHQQQQQQQQQQLTYTHHLQYNRENYILYPPPLEDPPPPPTAVAAIAKSVAGSSATMPKNCSRSSSSSDAGAASTAGGASKNFTAYAATTGSAAATLPKNLQQQRFLYYQQQQQYQNQQQKQQQQQPTEFNSAVALHHHHNHQQQQHTSSNTADNNNPRPHMPLPYQQQLKQKPTSVAVSDYPKQPPVPTRHSSVQQKIYVTTNPFVQTTAVHRVYAGAGSCSTATGTACSPSVGGNIHATEGAAVHINPQQHHPQQQYYVGSSSGHYGHHSTSTSAMNSNYATSSNLEKNAVVGCSSIRSKTKAEFLENLNAKLAKQGISGRAFAVRNLINSKALKSSNPQKPLCSSAQYRISVPNDETC